MKNSKRRNINRLAFRN